MKPGLLYENRFSKKASHGELILNIQFDKYYIKHHIY